MPSAGPRRVRVLVADDHELYRRSLCMLMGTQRGIEIVGEARNGAEALVLAELLKPEVILMDARMPLMDGVEATRRLKQAGAGHVVIGMSIDREDLWAREMKMAGAHAFLPKDRCAAELGATVGRYLDDRAGVAPA